MDKFMNYVFMILIAGFFTAIVFYAAHVFFPIENNNCWDKYNSPEATPTPDKNYSDPKVIAEQNAIQEQVNACNTAYDLNTNTQERYKLILIGAINILVLLLLIFLGLNMVSFGVFVGVLLSSIIAAIAFYNSSSKIALVIVVILFIEALVLLTRSINEKESEKNSPGN